MNLIGSIFLVLSFFYPVKISNVIVLSQDQKIVSELKRDFIGIREKNVSPEYLDVKMKILLHRFNLENLNVYEKKGALYLKPIFKKIVKNIFISGYYRLKKNDIVKILPVS
jgi:hypothetical protein